MNELMIFNNPEFGNIRTMELDGAPWFAGKDVAEILGYANPSKALADHVDNEDKLNNESLSSLGQRGGWIINESGLYSLVLGSKLPTAKKFKRWVTSEVIPSIRKHGGLHQRAGEHDTGGAYGVRLADGAADACRARRPDLCTDCGKSDHGPEGRLL